MITIESLPGVWVDVGEGKHVLESSTGYLVATVADGVFDILAVVTDEWGNVTDDTTDLVETDDVVVASAAVAAWLAEHRD